MPRQCSFRTGRRFRTGALIKDVDPPLVVMLGKAFASRDDLRVWLQNTATLTKIAALIGQRLNQ